MPTRENTAASKPEPPVAPRTGELRFPVGFGKTWEPRSFEKLLGDVTTTRECDYPAISAPVENDEVSAPADVAVTVT